MMEMLFMNFNPQLFCNKDLHNASFPVWNDLQGSFHDNMLQ